MFRSKTKYLDEDRKCLDLKQNIKMKIQMFRSKTKY